MLAIAGGKGGCGKTTSALGLARALARTSARPLVVDTDRDMPNLHHRAGVDPTPGIDAVSESSCPTAVAQPSTRFDGVDILPCTDASAAAIATVLHSLAHFEQPVILDCPAGAGPDAALPLRAADRSVLVSTPDEQSLTDTAKTAAMARELGASPAFTVLIRSDGTVDPSPLLSTPRTVHVPHLESPLESQEDAAKYPQMLKILHKRNA